MSIEPNWASPPGKTISRLMNAKDIPFEDLADGLGLASEEFGALIEGKKRICATLAAALAEQLGSTPRFWMARDKTYVEDVARLSTAEDSIASWAKAMPVKSMRQFGWIKAGLRGAPLQEALLSFFGCNNLADWNVRYSSGVGAVAFRTSFAFEADELATLVWLRAAEPQASSLKLSEFDPTAFAELLPKLRKLSVFKRPTTFLPRLINACASVGVAVTTARAPEGCRASGASWVSSGGRPIIHLSFRHRSEDHFWFTFFHEAAHVLLHGGNHIDGDGENVSLHSSAKREAEADEFAQNILLPEGIRRSLLSNPSAKQILSTAKAVGVTSGIIVGQLERAGAIPHGKLSRLKHRYRWGENAFVPELAG
ncbi:ImmA/IrrE family metallo-endopeptidase [Neorhizobium tomejilense]|uniref:ImmA/IrrE family metallo-endopeptidase n=1 Tax=Neorhizobium tomejilense TaxID=2093828 RepID=UPI000CF8803B|nr:ImmA/IrrE family metallo-endopeptidase [Neorhizobium tomejilense]